LKALENLLEFIFTIGWNPENGLVKNTIHTWRWTDNGGHVPPVPPVPTPLQEALHL
jgi:hypothetical protein